eukprot:m.126854 g.126854  ORF g.126854 m.126854 type:complete len:305 (+) comp19831_c2_seq1:2663-3577(+)
MSPQRTTRLPLSTDTTSVSPVTGSVLRLVSTTSSISAALAGWLYTHEPLSPVAPVAPPAPVPLPLPVQLPGSVQKRHVTSVVVLLDTRGSGVVGATVVAETGGPAAVVVVVVVVVVVGLLLMRVTRPPRAKRKVAATTGCGPPRPVTRAVPAFLRACKSPDARGMAAAAVAEAALCAAAGRPRAAGPKAALLVRCNFPPTRSRAAAPCLKSPSQKRSRQQQHSLRRRLRLRTPKTESRLLRRRWQLVPPRRREQMPRTSRSLSRSSRSTPLLLPPRPRPGWMCASWCRKSGHSFRPCCLPRTAC